MGDALTAGRDQTTKRVFGGMNSSGQVSMQHLTEALLARNTSVEFITTLWYMLEVHPRV